MALPYKSHPPHPNQRLLAAGSAASRRKRKDAHREYGAPRQAITPQRARRSPNSPTANLAEKEFRTPYHPCLLPSDARPKRRTGASQHGCAEMAAAVMPRAAASSRAATTSPASASHRHHTRIRVRVPALSASRFRRACRMPRRTLPWWPRRGRPDPTCKSCSCPK